MNGSALRPTGCLQVGGTLVQGSLGFVLRVSGLSQQRVDRLRMAVAAMWAASASWL